MTFTFRMPFVIFKYTHWFYWIGFFVSKNCYFITILKHFLWNFEILVWNTSDKNFAICKQVLWSNGHCIYIETIQPIVT